MSRAARNTVLLGAALMCACTSYVTVLRPSISVERTVTYPASTEALGTSAGAADGAATFRDSILTARFATTSDALLVTISNHSTSLLRVRWDDAAITTTSGRASRVVRIGESASSCQQPSASVTIPPDASAAASLTACEEAYSYGPAGVVTGSFFLGLLEHYDAYVRDSTLQRIRREVTGRRFSLLLPTDVDGNRRDYLFRFVVDSVRIGRDTIVMDASGRRVRTTIR